VRDPLHPTLLHQGGGHKKNLPPYPPPRGRRSQEEPSTLASSTREEEKNNPSKQVFSIHEGGVRSINVVDPEHPNSLMR
jgi:hypothetical protein